MQRMIIMRYIKMNSTVKNYTALFLGVAALSTSAIFVKLSTAPSPVTAFYRLLFTALALLPFLLCSEKNRREFAAVDRRQVLSIVLSGFLLAVHYTVLVSMQPLFSLFWGFLFLKERARPSALVGCLIAIAGSAVIGWGDFAISSKALLGDLLALSSAGVISLYFLIGQVTRKNTGVIVYSVLSYFSSAAFLLVYVLVSRNPFFDYPALTWCSFLGLAFISTMYSGVPYFARDYCAQAVWGNCCYYVWAFLVFFLSAGERAWLQRFTEGRLWIILKFEQQLQTTQRQS